MALPPPPNVTVCLIFKHPRQSQYRCGVAGLSYGLSTDLPTDHKDKWLAVKACPIAPGVDRFSCVHGAQRPPYTDSHHAADSCLA